MMLFPQKYWGAEYHRPRPDSSLICDSFSLDGFDYIRTPTKYFIKPVYGRLWKYIKKTEFDFKFSIYKTRLNQSQAVSKNSRIQGEFIF